MCFAGEMCAVRGYRVLLRVNAASGVIPATVPGTVVEEMRIAGGRVRQRQNVHNLLSIK